MEIADYRIGDRTFYANNSEPAVPATLARHIHAVVGFTDLAKPNPINGNTRLKHSENGLASRGTSTAQPPVRRAATAHPAELDSEDYSVIGLSNPPKPYSSDSSVPKEIFTSSCRRYAQNAILSRSYQECLVRVNQTHVGVMYGNAYLCEPILLADERRLFEQCTQGLGPGDGGNGPGGSGGSSSSSSQQFPLEAATSLRWLDVDGSGQKVGLLEFDTFNINDMKDHLALIGPSLHRKRLMRPDDNRMMSFVTRVDQPRGPLVVGPRPGRRAHDSST